MIEASVEFGVLMRSSLAAPEAGRQLLGAFSEEAPGWGPVRYNNVEPVNRSFESDGIEEALRRWSRRFLWRGRRGVAVNVFFGNTQVHSAIYLTLPRSLFDSGRASRLVGLLDRLFGVEISYIHPRYETEADDVTYYARHIMPMAQGLDTHRLREGLPWICWGMYFGRSYRDLFGSRLDSCPVFRTERIGQLHYLQLTERMDEVYEAPSLYRTLSEAAMEHLDSGAFVGTGADELVVPAFDIGSERTAKAEER